MNKALLILNSLEIRQKLYNKHIIGFDSIKPKEDVDNQKWLVVSDPEAEEFCEACLMYHSVDDRVKGYYDPESYIVMENEEEFFNKLKEYYGI